MVLLVVHGLAGVIWMPASQVLIHRIVGVEQLPSAVRLTATGRYLAFSGGPGGRRAFCCWCSARSTAFSSMRSFMLRCSFG